MPLNQQLKETSKQDIPLISCAAQIQKQQQKITYFDGIHPTLLW